jgi:hypothetical protein
MRVYIKVTRFKEDTIEVLQHLVRLQEWNPNFPLPGLGDQVVFDDQEVAWSLGISASDKSIVVRRRTLLVDSIIPSEPVWLIECKTDDLAVIRSLRKIGFAEEVPS